MKTTTKRREWILWAWSVDRWTAVLSSKSEASVRADEKDCNESGIRVVVMPKGVRP